MEHFPTDSRNETFSLTDFRDAELKQIISSLGRQTMSSISHAVAHLKYHSVFRHRFSQGELLIRHLW